MISLKKSLPEDMSTDFRMRRREGGREREKERDNNVRINCLPYVP